MNKSEFEETESAEETILRCDHCGDVIDVCTKCEMPFENDAYVYCSVDDSSSDHLCRVCFNKLKP